LDYHTYTTNMASGLSDIQIEEYREAFHLFDRNQDGTITSKDLGALLKAIGQNPSDEETRKLIERVFI
jgi:calmodulin